MFTREKEKEALFKFEGKMKPKNVYFAMYVVGLMLYGMGSYFFLSDMSVTILELKMGKNILSIVGIISVGIGMALLIWLFYQFYKRLSLKQKLRTALRNYLLLVLVSGVIFGLLGEAVYRMTSMNYDSVKQTIWILSTYVQGIGRFLFLYYCLKLFLEENIDWKSSLFKKLLMGVFLLVSLSIGFSLIIPVIGPMGMFITDLIIAIGIVYKELFVS